MGEMTAIKWTDHTFNPWMGCTKVSPGCDNCYAEALGRRTGRVQWGDDAERVLTKPAYWRNPAKWNADAEAEGRRHRVFVASLADVYEDRPELVEPRGRLFDLMAETPWLDWQVLTKRPENVLHLTPTSWLPAWNGSWPANVWIGTTVEDQQRADERIPHLLRVPAPVLFLSCEPLLGRVDLDPAWLFVPILPVEVEPPRIGWIIVGGESGPGHRSIDLDHARMLVETARAAGTPVFFKQVGGQFPTSGGHLLDGEVIQEFPT